MGVHYDIRAEHANDNPQRSDFSTSRPAQFVISPHPLSLTRSASSPLRAVDYCILILPNSIFRRAYHQIIFLFSHTIFSIGVHLILLVILDRESFESVENRLHSFRDVLEFSLLETDLSIIRLWTQNQRVRFGDVTFLIDLMNVTPEFDGMKRSQGPGLTDISPWTSRVRGRALEMRRCNDQTATCGS
jgi:hypothetical protein